MPGPSTANPRRRATLRETLSISIDGQTTPKEINAAPSLEKAEIYGIQNERSVFSKVMAVMGKVFMETIPQALAVGAMLGLIFGGCCSNVFALEAIVKLYPDSGTLLTFVQFAFVAITGYISQFDHSRPPLFLKPNQVPISRWLVNIALFFTINILNNHAFSYNISVPIHIILRSGGSVTTIVVGYFFGKRFSQLQISAVVLLTIGVIISAWGDSQGKEKSSSNQDSQSFNTGLVILFVAQALSAIMGVYTENTYSKYGPHWKENLFYSHLLSLPLFLPFAPSMTRQFLRLAESPPLALPWTQSIYLSDLPEAVKLVVENIRIPSQLAYLFLNVLTQYACIRGVNLLAAGASALTVTIVLNVRKLVSLLLSIWLFGNRLSPSTLIGAIIVFGAGGIYSLDKPKAVSKPRLRAQAAFRNGKKIG